MARRNPVIKAKGISDADVRRLGEAYLDGEDILATRRGRQMARAAAEKVHREFEKVSKKVRVIFTERDPYPDFEALRADVRNNKRMYIYTGHSVTPLWDEQTNWKARAVHDYDHVTEGAGFGLHGEFMAFRASAKKAPQLTELYMSEIPLQAAAYYLKGGFPDGPQKVVSVNPELTRLVNRLGMRQNPGKRRNRNRMASLALDAQILGKFMPPEQVAMHLGAMQDDAPVEEAVLATVSSIGRKRSRRNPPMTSRHPSNPSKSRKRKNPPPPTQKDLVEAISHADVYREGWTLSDFRVEYRGVFHGEDLDQYDDLSGWLDLDSLDDEEDLIGFRGEAWAKRAKKWGKNIPPIVVITAPDEDEGGRLHTQIGDGRGRVNYSVYSGIPLHVYEMTYVSPRKNPPQTSRHPMLLRHIVRGMFVQGSDNNATKTKAQIKQLVAMYGKHDLDPREELNLAFGTATNSLVDSGKIRKSKDGRRWVLTEKGERASAKKRREQSSAQMKRKDQQYEWILEFTRKRRR